MNPNDNVDLATQAREAISQAATEGRWDDVKKTLSALQSYEASKDVEDAISSLYRQLRVMK